MLSTVYSAGLRGVDGYIVTVECDVRSRDEAFEIVGLPDAAIREAEKRLFTGSENSGIPLPDAEISINLAPADTKKAEKDTKESKKARANGALFTLLLQIYDIILLYRIL